MDFVILLDSNYVPLDALDIEKTINMLFTGRAAPVNLDNIKPFIQLGLSKNRTAKLPDYILSLINEDKISIPRVIKLNGHRKNYKSSLYLRSKNPSRNGIYKRDRYECQYCSSKADLTIDHILPKSRGGGNIWENVVTCCHKCNNKKGNKTPEEIGFKLKSTPKAPPISLPSEFWSSFL